MAAGNQHHQSSSDRRQDQTDTTYTKVFVGGLAWETQRETMRRHFEQYGEIVEAVVITDKATGRSKGYGFVTFREPDAARRACQDPTPIIDGRRANCNLASVGAHHRPRPSLPFGHGNRFRAMAPITPASPHHGGAVYMGAPAYFQQGNYTLQYGIPYQGYGYPYSQEVVYQMGVYNPYGGMQYYSSPSAVGSSAVYPPYVQFSPPAQNFAVQVPQVMPYGASQTVTTLPLQPYGFVPIPPVTSPGGTLGFSSPSTVGSPRLSSPPPQVYAVQQQPLSHLPKSDQQSA